MHAPSRPLLDAPPRAILDVSDVPVLVKEGDVEVGVLAKFRHIHGWFSLQMMTRTACCLHYLWQPYLGLRIMSIRQFFFLRRPDLPNKRNVIFNATVPLARTRTKNPYPLPPLYREGPFFFLVSSTPPNPSESSP